MADEILPRHLSDWLAHAVPLWMERVRSWTPEEREAKAQAAFDTIGGGAGAVAVATGSMSPAELFNAMAMSLALAAYCPGGVTFAGNHWQAT